jgi:cytochrome d ubiquinol oxidase subunit II
MPELTPALLIAVGVVAALAAYLVMAGADFGGGVWDLFATGPRRKRQRALITESIGPIWEANHVWLILAVVLLFVCFPAAFARLSVSLHIPLTLMLVGIVLRGSAFTFRTYDSQRDDVQQRWGVLFSWASLITPVLLGVVAGTIAAGDIPVRPSGTFVQAYVHPWLRPFPLAIGALALALCAYLAAVYLTMETDDTDLQDDFRLRAFIAGLGVFVAAMFALVLARRHVPLVWQGLTATVWARVPGGRRRARTDHLRGALAAALPPRACGGPNPGGAHPRWVGALPVSLCPSPRPHHRGRRRARRDARTGSGRPGPRFVVLVPSLVYLFRVFKSRPQRV